MKKSASLLLFVAASMIALPAFSNIHHADSADQVAVKVNGQPILAIDFGIKMGLKGAGTLKPVTESDMKLMVDMELLHQAALQSRLDKVKEIQTRIAALPKGASKDPVRKVLALAYINKQLSGVPMPSNADVSAYFQSNSALYAERKHYELQTCMVKPVAGKDVAVKAQLSKSRNFEDFERWLRSSKIAHGCVPVSVTADEANEKVALKLKNVPVGGNVVEGSKEQMAVTYVKAMRSEPLSLEQATPTITRLLSDKRKSEAYEKMVKQLRDKAKIEYLPPYTANGLAPSLKAP